jgi:hypothetical protein
MKRLVLAILLALVAWGCPDPQTGKVDPYLTARTIILQANTALALSDGIFNQWLLGQTDAEKAKKAQTTYQKVKTSVSNGLQLALNGVAIAEQAKKDPDVKKLMAEANGAWDNLRKFLEDLLAKPEDAALVTVASAAEPPASQPATTKTSGGVASKTSALTAKKSPLDSLPKKLY